MSGSRAARSELLKESAIDSIRLSIELYNRPYSLGRDSGVLLHLGRGLELLLKACILNYGESIEESDSDGEQTIGLTRAINLCHTASDNEDVRFLAEEAAIALRKIKYDRDAAAHNLVETSEKQLYTFAQTGVSIFDDILMEVFEERLADSIPGRVLPLSTDPPENMAVMMDSEYSQIQDLIDTGEVTRAKARLRSIEGLERAINDDEEGPISDSDLEERLKDIEGQPDWTEIFQGVSSINFTTEGAGPSFKVRLTKSEGMPVQLVDNEEAQEENAVVGVKRVTERDYYSLGIKDIGDRLPISWQKAKTVAMELELLEDEEYYKEISLGENKYKRYSEPALRRIEQALEEDEVDPDQAWQEHGW
jgi:hypothetical protein